MKIDIVFLHGWAMNSAVWQPCLQRLPNSVQPRCIDLPGYGEHADVAADTLDGYAEHVARLISRPAVVVGWSLGGLVSLQLARRYPEKVSVLFQVATSPKFVQDGGWQAGIERSVFEQFAVSLEKDIEKTIRRFLALQVRATDTSMQTVRELQASIDERGLPAIETLRAGLAILAETDLRAAVQQLSCPVTWLLGQKDMLVPVGLADVLRAMPVEAAVEIVPSAGHAPFISDPDDFVRRLLQTLERS